MSPHWHTLALRLLACSLLSGCFLGHRFEPAPSTSDPDAGPLSMDPPAAPEPTPPASPEPPPVSPEPPPVSPEPAPPQVCGVRDEQLRIAVTTDTFSAEPCIPGPVDGWIDGVEETDEALEMVIDSCPPWAFCSQPHRCRIRIEGIGEPIGASLEGHDYLSGWADPGFLRLRRTVSCCRGPGCYCGPNTVLYARTANPADPLPDALPDEAEELWFQRLASECGEGCGLKPFALEARFDGQAPAAIVPEALALQPGETQALGETGIQVRVISSQRDACTDEPGVASWIAWLGGDRGGRFGPVAP